MIGFTTLLLTDSNHARDASELFSVLRQNRISHCSVNGAKDRFVGIGKAEPITAKDISFYLAQSFRMYIESKYIEHIPSKHCRKIRLNEHIIVKIPVKSKTVIKNVFIAF